MQIAVVGGTGRVGRPLVEALESAGHRVRVLSRRPAQSSDGRAPTVSVVTGSFDEDTAPDDFFADADAAFVLVRSDWDNVDHYPATAARLAAGLRRHTPERVVYLSSIGADLADAGHSTDFGLVEAVLDEAVGGRLVRLRAGWFMENFIGQTDEILRTNRLTTRLRLDLALPLVATRDIARAAARAILAPHHVGGSVREVQGPADVTMREAAEIIGAHLGQTVSAVTIPPPAHPGAGATSAEVAAWQYRIDSDAAFNDGRVRFAQERSTDDLAAMEFATFVRDVWRIAPRGANDFVQASI